MTSAGKRKPRKARASVMTDALGGVAAGAPLLPGYGLPLNATDPLNLYDTQVTDLAPLRPFQPADARPLRHPGHRPDPAAGPSQPAVARSRRHQGGIQQAGRDDKPVS